MGLEIEEISKSINEPDKFTLIDLNEKQKEVMGYSEGETNVIGIYYKKFPLHYNLTISRNSKDEAIVLGSFKMLHSNFSGLETMTPLEALQEFLSVFGITQSIFGKRRKLFYAEVIQQPRDSVNLMATPSINPPKNHEVLQTAFTKIEGIAYQVFCGLAFCVDYTLYLDFLRLSK